MELPVGPPDLGLLTGVGLLAGGWLAGSFPSAVLVGRRVGIDVLREGEGNPGSANVWAVAGPVAGAAVFLLDIGKVAAPGLVGFAIGGWWGAWVAAMGAVGGAMRPVVPGWRGGRGVNAGVGAAIVLHPPAAAIGFAAAALVYAVSLRRPAAITAGFIAYPAAFALLSVRSPAAAWPLAGIGLLYLVLLARFAVTARPS